MYSLKGIKQMQGLDGWMLNANLYHGGKRIGYVVDDGNGGCMHLQIDKAEEAAFLVFVSAWYETSKFKAEFEALCLAHPLPTPERALSASEKAEYWVSEYVDTHEETKRLNRLAKSKTLFQLDGDDADEWRTLNTVGPRALAFLEAKYGKLVKRIWGQK